MSRIRHQHYQPVAIESGSPTADLFSPPFQPVDTSEAAAERVKPSALSIREQIYALIAQAGERGMTAGELELVPGLGFMGSTIRPRLRELEGSAPWAKGRLRARIVKTPYQRQGMRIYRAL
jgi:hypothetical protein